MRQRDVARAIVALMTRVYWDLRAKPQPVVRSGSNCDSNGDAAAFGSATYSVGECVAEMTAPYLYGIAGIENRTVDNFRRVHRGMAAPASRCTQTRRSHCLPPKRAIASEQINPLYRSAGQV